MEVVGQRHDSAALLAGMTVQPVARRYNECAIPAHVPVFLVYVMFAYVCEHIRIQSIICPFLTRFHPSTKQNVFCQSENAEARCLSVNALSAIDQLSRAVGWCFAITAEAADHRSCLQGFTDKVQCCYLQTEQNMEWGHHS